MPSAERNAAPAAPTLAIASSEALDPVRRMVAGCMQCGTCTASCPNAWAMDLTPRRLWRLITFGQEEEVLASRTLFLCSTCYTCSLRCPRGLPLTQAMAALKRLAFDHAPKTRRRAAFYRSFVEHIQHRGRVQETALMSRYFLASRDPSLPLAFTGPGLRLLRKGKLHWPGRPGRASLERLMDAVLNREERP